MVEKRLRDKFPHLHYVAVVNCKAELVKQQIARKAAEYIRGKIGQGATMAASCGTAVRRGPRMNSTSPRASGPTDKGLYVD